MNKKDLHETINKIYDSVLEKSKDHVTLYAGKHQYISYSVKSKPNFAIGELLEYIAPHAIEKKEVSLKENWSIHLLKWDFEIEHMPEITHTDAMTFIKEKSGSYTLIDWKSYQRWHILRTDVVNREFIQDVYCGIRRIISRSALKYGAAILLHSASFNKNNRTFIVAGKKGSGKSFLSYYAMIALNAKFIAGDQTLIWIENDREIYCSGTIASYRININDRKQFSNITRHDLLMEHALKKYSNPNIAAKLSLTPYEFCKIAAVEMVSVSKPEVLLFLEKAEGSIIEKIEPEKTIKLLEANLLHDMIADIRETKRQYQQRDYKQKIAINEIAHQCEAYILPIRPPLSMIERILAAGGNEAK